ncbi:MAG: SEC-C domain-containing protein, partial [Actinomycetota bacterium]|nr:SEC-C domain-containing protein [Actinomycetota bacterium]
MDPEKAVFLAGVDELELDEYDAVGMARGVIREMIAEQIADDDPPQVWQTARRLLDGGMERLDVWRQLALALDSTMLTAMGPGFDRDGYVDVLDRLPLPSAERVEQVIVDIVRDRQPIDADELDRLVSERIGMPLDDQLTEALLDQVHEQLLDDGPLAMLPPDVVVHVPSLTAGIVLTHRLTEAEREAGVLYVGDLPGFGRTELAWQGSAIWEYVGEDGRSRWLGPPGWLEPLRPGLIAVRVDADGEVTITPLDGEPACSAELVTSVRAAYDAEVAEPWLPVGAEDLLLGVLVRDRSAFAEPAPPLSELAAAAGLEEGDERYAHDESVWQQAERFRRDRRMLDRLGPGLGLKTALGILARVDEGVPDAAAAHEVLRGLYHPDVLEVVPNELLGTADDPGLVAELVALAGRLLAVASKPGERAVAHWLAALSDERRGAVLDAESHLREAVRADPDWPCAQDRLAWYESDRGDAAAALARWRRLGATAEVSQDVATVQSFAAATEAPKLGRNQRCWCGSGRKYKVCHLGKPERAPLPDRVGWLCRKATAYLERRGGGVGDVVMDHALARASDPDDPDAAHEALADPLVLDVALHESGWFERFLTDRGPLLPQDEAMLARAWTLVERSVCEVLDVEPGRGLTVRDLRTGDRTVVRERSFSRDARVGELLCARVVPDGESHQFIGGLFRVAPGTEKQLLDVLDQRDGYGLLHFVAQQQRPPMLVTGDGDPLRECRAELAVGDPAAARAELDRRYEPDGDGWVWF